MKKKNDRNDNYKDTEDGTMAVTMMRKCYCPVAIVAMIMKMTIYSPDSHNGDGDDDDIKTNGCPRFLLKM